MRGKCCSPVVFHGKITMFRTGRPRNIMQAEGEGKVRIREQGDENRGQFRNSEIQTGILTYVVP
jgi:hypothetical protein